MGVPGAALGHDQVIVVAKMVDARALGAADAGAAVDLAPLAKQCARLAVDLLHQHPLKAVYHIDKVAFAVRVMQQRGVKPDAVQVDGFAPRACDGRRTAHVVVGVVPAAFFGQHIRDEQVVILPVPA